MPVDATACGRLRQMDTHLRLIDWIEDLVKTGKAIRLRGGGWPSLYTATAENLISQIIDGPPKAKDYLLEECLQSANAAACSPDEWLWIKAWDQD